MNRIARDRNEGNKNVSRKICQMDECQVPVHSRNLCDKHYRRLLHRGSTDELIIESHGMSGSPEYMSWSRMKQRCYNPNHSNYHNYGGRGIRVCKRWRESFSAFYEDMGPKPAPDYQIDRINNDGNYEPGNCRWITPTENLRNTRRTNLDHEKVNEIRKAYQAGGITHKELARRYRVGRSTISSIIRRETWRE